jgi:HAMP domain-containing protein
MTVLYVLLTAVMVIFGLGMFLMQRRTDRALRELKDSARNDQSLNLMSQWLQDTKSSLDGRLQETRQTLDSRLAEVDRKIGNSMESVSQRLEGNTKTVGDRLDSAARVIGEVQKQLGVLSKATDAMQEMGKDISSLQDILRSPKLRGGMGEYFLGDLLAQILPPHHFELQYTFRSGERWTPWSSCPTSWCRWTPSSRWRIFRKCWRPRATRSARPGAGNSFPTSRNTPTP